MNTLENKVLKKLIDIVFFMAGMLMYHVNIFGNKDLHELNRKIGDIFALMQDEESE